MSAREALINEINKQPEAVLRELQHYLAFLLEQQGRDPNSHPSAGEWPAGYFEKTAGAFASERFERPPQLPFENRQAW